MKQAHEDSNHMGRDIMRLILSDYKICCSGGKEKLIQKYMECDICSHTKRFIPDEESYTPIISKYPFERLQMDVTYPPELKSGSGRKYQATAKDHFSSKGWTQIIDKRDSSTLAKFLQDVVDDAGFPPDIVHSDN